MKNTKHLLLIIFLALATSVFAQDKTESVKVYGNCEMCKSRVEKAIQIDGVKKAGWDVDTKMLTVTYDSGKTNFSDIQKKVAAAGHDTENVRAEDAIYKKLPGCCRYDRKAQTESHSGHKH
ncbi:Copper chaperone CopZ [Cnuella takakiae]|uniref:Copper chaperone CopZ n=1 Tax=Cnuella takakiae TaxID=1302690 RepID=A0A1M4SLA5_9BACT|nr:heavy-metal-associated domain-containing protein [Cnuella takakiae]OLY94536.1 ATPase [Cnuella takakiae]SHE32981.1 Copper chaperone CopZ [Cnuella takakiae]